ncbi:MAG: hypothetical protein H7256_05585 [Bdellovibrio sp.]|nr:hypothetical protein [Bdellovibrio sp.]
MSRAVIDQAGFRVVFIGFILSLVMGLGLRTQIAPARVKALLQDSVSLLDKDFIIDFTTAEVVLSNWGLPLPSLQISNIRVSPKKSICQDSQIFIEHLNLPLSFVALITSESLITEINANHVELRIADFEHCFDDPKKPAGKESSVAAGAASSEKANDNHFSKSDSASVINTTETTEKNIFQSRTAALLKRINIDQLKLIYKKYPTQSIDFRHLTFDLGYEKDRLNQIDINSQVYALKDVQSDIMYFKGDLGVQIVANKSDQIETVLKLNGRLLDGEIQLFALVNSVEKNIKLDMKAKKVAVKPLIQMKLIESNYINFPMTFDFRGYGFYQYDKNIFSEIKLNDIEISGERTRITIDELSAKSEKDNLVVQSFKANIQRLNLNKLVNLSQNKNIAQSIENFGEFSGFLSFKNLDHMAFDGSWAGLEFIFANRGYRELQKIDSFAVKAKLDRKEAEANLSRFVVNKVYLKGDSNFSYKLDTGFIQAKANLEGPILNERVWALLTQLPQSPNVGIHWNYKKNKDEKHQLSMSISEVQTFGLKLQNLDFNFNQTLQDGVSVNVGLIGKASKVSVIPGESKINLLTEIFNSQSDYRDREYVAENFHLALKGNDWRTMSFDLDSHLKPADSSAKNTGSLKAKGQWTEDDVLSGILSIQSAGKNNKYQLIKNQNNELGVIAL